MATAVPLAMRERMAGPFLRGSAGLAIPLATGLLLAALGPFGTYGALDPVERTVFWCGAIGANWLIADTLVRLVLRRAPPRLQASPVLARLVAAFLASLPATGVVAGLGALIGFDVGALPDLYWKVLLITVALTLVASRGDSYTRAPAVDQPAAPGGAPDPDDDPGEPVTRDRFAERLPPGLGGRLICLQMEDHYLRIHTHAGEGLILCRMEDAARDLEGRGLRVHRSWWVAGDAVVRGERDGTRAWLYLSGGRRVPVGRTYRAAVRAAGWFDRGQTAASGPADGADGEERQRAQHGRTPGDPDDGMGRSGQVVRQTAGKDADR